MKQPVALTVAGSDSGGGAGIQADLKTFVSLQVHGTSAITCLTAQNPKEVRAVEPATPNMVLEQMEAVFSAFPVGALKTGMLFAGDLIKAVVGAYSGSKRPPLIVDQVMVASSGAKLLQDDAIEVLRNELLPMCDLVTPNIDEARLLVGRKIEGVDDLRGAAKSLFDSFGCSALVKGGHLPQNGEVVDCFFDGEQERVLRRQFQEGVDAHGTGCTLSAAITAYIARGVPWCDAVQGGADYVFRAIKHRVQVDSCSVLNTHWLETERRQNGSRDR